MASHISTEVISLCRSNNIQFICLPSNSTDKLQPLDVGFFGPVKYCWRAQLRKYADRDPTAKLLQKTDFPGMLKVLMDTLKPKEHLPRAFEKCGIFPINRQKVLDRIPSALETQEIAHHVDQALLKKLEVRRFGDGTKRKPRGKKLPAGHYSADDDSQEDSEEAESELESGLENEQEEDRDKEDEEVVDEECEELPDLNGPGISNMEKFVVAAYEGQWFLAEVIRDQKNVTKGSTRLSYMTIKGNNCFSWGKSQTFTMPSTRTFCWRLCHRNL